MFLSHVTWATKHAMDDGDLLENVVENADNLGNQNLVGANDAPMATTNIIGPSAAGNSKNFEPSRWF